MKATKIVVALSLLTLTVTGTNAAYKEIQCSADPIFAANSCNQCFSGWSKGEGANLGFLKDEWVNTSTVDKMLYKEEQEMPKMVNLNSSLVSWKEVPWKAGFWEYTADFNKLYKADEEGYILGKGKKVVWLASKNGYAYKLEKNKVEAGKNIGLLVYPISTHNISSNGDISVDSVEHKECVLFTSWAPVVKENVATGTTPSKNTPAKKLPKTGPEHYILLMLLAMVLGFGIMKLRKNA